MKRILISWILLLCITICYTGQTTCQNSPDYQQQIAFIKKDTLPVEIQLLPKIINTPYSEYNGQLWPDSTFYFTSLRPESTDDYANIFEQFWTTKLYESHLNIGGYSRPIAFPHSINDSRYYNCNYTFNSSRNLIIFARCERESSKQLQCNLWQSIHKNNRWQKPELLNRRINLPGTTSTQPYWVDYEDYSVMYFVSNRPKGYGELDIWYSIYRNNRFSDPINAGSNINTPDSEISPFYDKKTGRLYFSSDGTHLTIGGYDIFYCSGAMSQWGEVTNMGVPFNSEANDMYFSVNQHNNDGFFASNRPKSPEEDADTCCTDLFTFHWIETTDTTSPVDSVEIDTITATEKAVRLLPITLYFHNDEPDPRTTATTTKQNYRQTLSNYLAMKNIYQEEYAKGLKGEEAAKARSKIESFFTDSVSIGYLKLEQLTQWLLQDLQNGNNVTITVCGFASPLHKADYNVCLSARRISSLVNYLQECGNGLLLPYLQSDAPVKLTIVAEPEGASKAHKEVSDNPNDKRNSIYSVAAAIERKIQITRYELK